MEFSTTVAKYNKLSVNWIEHKNVKRQNLETKNIIGIRKKWEPSQLVIRAV